MPKTRSFTNPGNLNVKSPERLKHINSQASESASVAADRLVLSGDILALTAAELGRDEAEKNKILSQESYHPSAPWNRTMK